MALMRQALRSHKSASVNASFVRICSCHNRAFEHEAVYHLKHELLLFAAVAMSLMYSASTQACAAVLVAFKALGVKEAALKCLIEEWAHLGILEVSIFFSVCPTDC